MYRHAAGVAQMQTDALHVSSGLPNQSEIGEDACVGNQIPPRAKLASVAKPRRLKPDAAAVAARLDLGSSEAPDSSY